MLHVKLENYPTPFDARKIRAYKPTVLIIYMYSQLTKYGGDESQIEIFIDDMLKKIGAASCPVFVCTPLWASEKGRADCKSKGPNYQMSERCARAIRKAAQRYAYPVIDLFAMCEAEQGAGLGVYYNGKTAGNSGMAISAHGKEMVFREIRRVLGLPIATD